VKVRIGFICVILRVACRQIAVFCAEIFRQAGDANGRGRSRSERGGPRRDSRRFRIDGGGAAVSAASSCGLSGTGLRDTQVDEHQRTQHVHVLASGKGWAGRVYILGRGGSKD
jgi:hypothetical protein